MKKWSISRISQSSYKVVILYAALSLVYIFYSDKFLKSVETDATVLTKVQTFKGVGFVLITALLLFFLVRRYMKALEKNCRELAEKDRIYKALVENNNDIILQLDNTGIIKFATHNLEQVLGYTPVMVECTDIFALMHPDDVKSVVEVANECKRQPGVTFTSEFRMRHKDGNMVWVECNIVNRFDDEQIRGIVVNARDIQKRKVAEEMLSASEADYLSLFNHSPLPMWIFEIRSGDIIMANEAACRIYGYDAGEYLKMNLRDLSPAEDIALLEETLRISELNIMNSNSPVLRHRKHNGEIILVKIENSRVTFEGKEAWLALAVDVTEEMFMRNRLVESNERLHNASEIAKLGYWSNNLVTGHIEWSEELYKIFELEPGEIELTIPNISEFYKEGLRPVDSEGFEEQFVDGRILEAERMITTKNGKEKWLLERLNLEKNEAGQPVGMEGIVLDITNRKQSEQTIWQSNERFKIVMKATVEALIDWDIVNDRVVWGDGFEHVFGYDLTEYDNFLWSRNIHPDDKEDVEAKLREVVNDPTKELFYMEFRFLRANRDVAYVQHRAIFIRDESGKAIRAVGAIIDVTESMWHLKRIEKQNEALREIAWIQSHVVRAPLASLMGLMELLKAKDELKLDEAELVDNIISCAHQLDQIVRQIADKTAKVE